MEYEQTLCNLPHFKFSGREDQRSIYGNRGNTLPLSYRAYLRKRKVSYIIAGKTELDCEMAMEKLHRLFGIEKLLICGGGVANWTFLQAGVVDELSLVLSPVTDGSSGTAAVFSQIPTFGAGKSVKFNLKTVERIGDGGLYLNYLAKNTEQAV